MYLIKIYSAGFSTAYMTSRRSLFSVQAGSGVWVTPFGSFSRHSHLLRQWQPFMVKVTLEKKTCILIAKHTEYGNVEKTIQGK